MMRLLNPAPGRRLQILEGVILLVATIFFALHFVHLSADFPNRSPWMDWSKYTDEGWYGDAAIRHFQLGHWNVPGDFNPAAALPVWPFVEAIVFRFTGVSLIAARALTVCVFGGILIFSYLLLSRWDPLLPSLVQLPLPFLDDERAAFPARARQHTLAPAFAVLLLAVSPFCFAFMRLAILEPILILLTLLALHAASAAPAAMQRSAWIGSFGHERSPLTFVRLVPSLTLGLLLTAMILTKTTALFLFPAVFFLLWASSGYSLRLFLRAAVPAALLAAFTWCAFFFLAIRPHYLSDYRYLFSANAYTGITPATALSVLADTARDGLWMGDLLYPLALFATLLSLLRFRTLAQRPLVPTLLLWTFGYAAFLAYHDNLQPRYYLVVAVPFTLLVGHVCEPALRRPQPTVSAPARPLLAFAAAIALAAIILRDARQTIHFARHPEYTLVRAASLVAQVVKANPSQSPLVLSISGSDLSLMTGLPSICDDFGTLELADRVKRYRPGWYAAWNEIDDDKMDALTPLYHPVRVAAFPAMDDPDRNLLILYRLDDKTQNTRLRGRRRQIPRPLQTAIGQQPSVSQLQH